ncbi:MurR/RpiR family transcriptional regulator [Paenarthrobacter sp. NPDC089989]|uniref:MurR/RpiR family transcriptional regulator n=1 Tax=unclassified Paenarthrobacter TaxID=2634190 RepID=UPI003800093D
MSFREALKNAPGTLTSSELRISEVLLGDRRGAPLYTAAQLAEVANVHESTVVRFAQKLGYSGYLALRLELASDSVGPSRPSKKQPGLEETSLAQVLRGQIEVLEKVEEHVPQASIDGAMKALLAADRVFIAANGLTGPLADFFARKIALLGIPSTVIHQTGNELGHQLGTVRPADIVVFFLLSSEYEAMKGFEGALLEQGTTVVLVTDQPILALHPQAPFVLAVPRSELNHGVFVVLATIGYAMDYSLMQQLGTASVREA